MDKTLIGPVIACVTLVVLGLFIFTENDSLNKNEQILDEKNEDYLPLDEYPHTSEFHWAHMPLTYNFDQDCEFKVISKNGIAVKEIDNLTVSQIERGLEFISKKTNGAVKFIKINESESDIFYVCDTSKSDEFDIETPPVGGGFYSVTLGEAEIYTYEGSNLFAPGRVNLIRLGEEECADERPIIVIHETLHMLGLEHINVYRNIMNPYVMDDCKSDISKEHLDYLWSIYDPEEKFKPFKGKYNCEEPYYSCTDFTSRFKAQEVLDFCGKDSDIHNIDPDKDGIACENLI